MEKIGVFLSGPSVIEDRNSLIGQQAPAFQLRDESGSGVTLNRLTRRGPLLLHFYRGDW